uniref:Uncharacterized protein n=1 Tax=Amycolatopsis pretoriensis TaxID=218821 RepID=A0A1H5QCV7_9PSEU|nr:hypothetical protein SAMN05421837_102470 [Amycolatopsis pretoriensis]
MSLPQQQSPQLRNPIPREPVLNPGQSQRPPRRPGLVEHGGSQPPTSLHHQPRIDRIPLLPGQSDVPPNLLDRMLRPKTPHQIHPGEILVNLPIRQMSQNNHPRRNHPQRKPSPLEKNMAPNRKSPILPDQTNGLLPPPRGKESTLPGGQSQPPHHRQSGLGDVVPPSGSDPEEVQLRSENPPVGIRQTLHQPDPLQRRQQPVHSRPRQPGLPGHSGRRSPTGLVRGHRAQSAMSPSDQIHRSVHSPDTTPPKPTTRRTIPRWNAFTG